MGIMITYNHYLKPYVTKIFSEKVEIYGILFEKSLFCAYTKGNTFTIVCVLFLLWKLKFLLWSALD